MPITPDTRDWTWVLERPCPECGVNPSARRGSARGSAATGRRSRSFARYFLHDPLHHLHDVGAPLPSLG